MRPVVCSSHQSRASDHNAVRLDRDRGRPRRRRGASRSSERRGPMARFPLDAGAYFGCPAMTAHDVVIPSRHLDLRGHLALPEAPGPHPGVVVIHEIYGLNDNIRDVTGRLAAEGYASLAVDLFAGRNRAICMARLMGASLAGRGGFAVTDLRASAEFLSAQPEVDGSRIGVIGFCMGG
ncbi:MAG TPA: hypothetical protein DCX12_03800, partial [Chloroflexi bacterium]|nr:hypothetical protein [Chloroflexota bacterium]